jgi:tetratricopeptide (TPR) repeat protein
MALDLAQAQGQRRLAGAVAANIGRLWEAQGDFVRANSCFMQALAIQRQIEDRAGVAMTQIALGRIALMLGDSADAQGQLTASLTALEEIGECFHRCEVLTTLALLWLRQGDLARALETGQQAVEFAQAARIRGALSEALLLQGHILAALGRTADAGARYVETMGLVTELQDDVLEAPARAGLADLALSAGERADALAAVERLLPVLPALRLDALVDPFRVYLTCYRVLAAAGDARAQEVALAAQTRLRGLADQITDPAMRWRFLEQVPSNRTAMLLLTA